LNLTSRLRNKRSEQIAFRLREFARSDQGALS